MSHYSNKEDQRPSMQFYVNDWLACPELRRCTIAARGLWMDILCVMWLTNPRGFFIAGDSRGMARSFGIECQEYDSLMAELEENQVYEREGPKIIFCRRMRRLAEGLRKTAEDKTRAGKKGAEARWGKQSDSRAMAEGDDRPVAEMAASSSSSPSSPSSTASSSSKEKKEKKRKENEAARENARIVFDYYLSKGLKQYRVFSTWEPKIKTRLKKYSVDDLKLCIDNIAASEWHRDNGQHGLQQIVDTDKRIEKWLVWEKPKANSTGQQSSRPSNMYIEGDGNNYADRKPDAEG